LLLYSLYLTATVSRMSNQIRHLISTVAILESNIPSLPRDSAAKKSAG
jgi:hypothetical protein